MISLSVYWLNLGIKRLCTIDGVTVLHS